MEAKPGIISMILTRRFRIALYCILSLALLSIYILNASRPGRAAAGCLQGCVSASPRRAGPMRVLSLNMLHGFPSFTRLRLRVDLIITEIRRLDADVVLLQEVPWTIQTGNVSRSMARELGYNYVYYRANGNKNLIFFEEGEAILSRFPLTGVITSQLLPRAGFFESRVSLAATALTPWGEISFFVAHLTNKDSQVGQAQSQALWRFVESHSKGMAVVAGDFNALEDSPLIQTLSSAWVDTYRQVHPNDPGFTCCVDDLQAGPGEPLEKRIDYVFVRQLRETLVTAEHAFYRPFSIGNGWQWASDHTGLIVEIQP